MSQPLPFDDEDTEALKRAVLRPRMIAEHRPAVEEIDACLGDSLVMGRSDNPRLQQVLAELDDDSERARIESSLRELAAAAPGASVRHALLDHLALLRAEKKLELARMQIHAIGIYRRLAALVHERQRSPPTLDEVRELPAAVLTRLLAGRKSFFGDADLRDDLVVTPGAIAAARHALDRLVRPAESDSTWEDADGPPELPERVIAPLRELPPENREPALRLAEQDQVRSRFFRAIFLEWFSADTLDVEAVGCRTVLDWLLAIEETPHLFPFMQGQTPRQKAFRLARLTDKLLQMHEIYARTGHYARQDAWRDRLAGLKTRERLAVIGKERLPALPMSASIATAVVLLPFAAFARWVQQRIADKDFVLPPERR